MLKDKTLQQNTADRLARFASFSRGIHRLKQMQGERKLKDKLAAEPQASPNPASRCCLTQGGP